MRAIEISDLGVFYGEGSSRVAALSSVSLTIEAGEFVSISGPSGSGKSTLLNVVAGLESLGAGFVKVFGADVAVMGASESARMRRRTIAYIFQFFGLLTTMSAAENVALPLHAEGCRRADIDERVDKSLRSVGMAARASSYPEQLSGGEMQRVAIARALAMNARIILADEPTGNLDSVRGEEILELLKQAQEVDGRTVILVTHDRRAAAYGNRTILLRDGCIVGEVEGGSEDAEIIPLRSG